MPPQQPAQSQQIIKEALGLAVGFQRRRQFDEAEKLYIGVLEIDPNCVDALNLLGVVQHLQGHTVEGLALIDRALKLEPRSVRILNNRATILAYLGRHREALEVVERIIARERSHVDAHWNRGLLHLTLGNFRKGWPDYEWRWKKRDRLDQPRNFKQPLWRGDAPLRGKTILLHMEQGYGDTIQFIRYAPMVAERGARVIVEADAALQGLLSRIEGISAFVSRGSPLPDFDLHCPLMSLPLAFDTDLASIPASASYLTASPERLEQWRARLGPPGHRIGLVWAGNRTHHNDRNRSIELRQFEPLLADPRIQAVSLQREVNDDDRAWLEQHGVLNLGGEFTDFDDTAAVVTLLDQVITVDTSIAHLAGALAKPTWILLPLSPDWRWMLEREDSPWYPTAKLWRQITAGDWESVFTRMSRHLAAQL